MKTRNLAAACALAVAFASHAEEPGPGRAAAPGVAQPEPPAAASPPPAAAPPRYGFGLATGLVPGSSGRLDTQGLQVSFAILRDRLRIEPTLGFGFSRLEGFATRHQYSLGCGILWELARMEPSVVYAGGRVALSIARYSDGTSTLQSTGESLAAVIGGEYLFSPFMSLGIEASAGLSAAQSDGSSGNDDVSGGTGGELLLRFYLP